MDKITLKAMNATNRILKDYGTDNGYNMTENRSLIPLLYRASENDFKRLNYLEGRILAKQERYC